MPLHLQHSNDRVKHHFNVVGTHEPSEKKHARAAAHKDKNNLAARVTKNI